MRTGEMQSNITIYTLTTVVTNGDSSETWDAGVVRRAKVTQIDGTRYLAVEQLTDREVYKIILWDNSYSNNIKILYGTKTLVPIRPPQRNADRSNRDVMTIIAATEA